MLYAKMTDTAAEGVAAVAELYEIIYVLEGEGRLVSGTKKYPFYPGCIFVIPPAVSYTLRGEGEFSAITVGGENELLTFVKSLNAMTDNLYREGGYLAEMILRNAESEDYASSLYKAYVKYVLKNIRIPQDVSSVVYRLTVEIENRYHECDLDVTELLRRSGYAEDYIRSKFRQLTGKTPVKYLNGVRMKNARALVAMQGVSLADIAQRCGFLDAEYFAKLFKRYYGVSPRNYNK